MGSLSSSMGFCRRYQGYAGYVLEFGMEPSNSFLKHGGLEVLMMMMMTTTTMMMMTTTTTMMMTTTITRYSVRRWSQFYPKILLFHCLSFHCHPCRSYPPTPRFFPPVINHGKQGHPQHLWEIHRTEWRNLQHTMGHSWGKPKRKPTRDGNQSTGYESTILNYHS